MIVRIAVSALILTVPALIQLRGRWGLLRRAAPRVAVYGLLAVAGCELFYFNALQRIPVGVALLLEYLGAVLVVLWAWLRHGQRPRRLTVTGTVSAIAGLMVLNLTGTGHIDPVGVMWGLLAAGGLAVYFVLSQPRRPPPDRHGLGGHVRRGRCARPDRLGRRAADEGYGGRCGLPRPPGQLAGAGARALAGGRGDRLRRRHRAARRLGAKLASFIGMTEVLFAILFAWLALGQLPSPVQFLGGAFILAGIALVRAGERAPARPADERPVASAAQRYEPSRT